MKMALTRFNIICPLLCILYITYKCRLSDITYLNINYFPYLLFVLQSILGF